jgi:hypothetical protein
VVDYHGLGHRHLTTPRLLVRPQLSGATLGRRGMVSLTDWHPITEDVAWDPRPLVSLQKARSFLCTALGPPQARDVESDGIGPYDLWAMRFACGLEVLLLAFHWDLQAGVALDPDQENRVVLESSSADWAHIAIHLPFDAGAVTVWMPDRRASDPLDWTVLRQDDNGNVFEVQSCSSRCEAHGIARKLESHGHKQIYWVTERDHDIDQQTQDGKLGTSVR